MSIESFGKIYAIGHKHSNRNKMSGYTTIEEKLDGSQFGFGVKKGTLYIRSNRAQILNLEEGQGGNFGMAIDRVLAVQNYLHEGWEYRAEAITKPKHNSITYELVPAGGLVIFDIDRGEQDFLDYREKATEAKRLDLKVTQLFWEGDSEDIPNIELLEEWAATEMSILGAKTPIEGIVIKNYGRFGQDGKIIKAKLVSDKFKETHGKSWKNRNPGGNDIITKIADSFNKEAIWDKAIQHTNDDVGLDNDPKDISSIIKNIDADIDEEHLDHIQDQLMAWALGQVKRKVKKGFPEYYKSRIQEKF